MIGFAICGSFCTFARTIEEMERMVGKGYDIQPIMSYISYTTDTRFGRADEFITRIEGLCGRKIWHTIVECEPIGPKDLLEAIVVAPCTGNTIAKLVCGITDTSVTMAVKATLRNDKPVVVAVSTNDALGANAKNIGVLMNTKNVYLVPFRQDDTAKKPTSMVADMGRIVDTLENARRGRQVQPLYIPGLASGE